MAYDIVGHPGGTEHEQLNRDRMLTSAVVPPRASSPLVHEGAVFGHGSCHSVPAGCDIRRTHPTRQPPSASALAILRLPPVSSVNSRLLRMRSSCALASSSRDIQPLYRILRLPVLSLVAPVLPYPALSSHVCRALLPMLGLACCPTGMVSCS